MKKILITGIMMIFSFIFIQPASADTAARGPLAQALLDRADKDNDGDVDQDDQLATTTVEVGTVGTYGTVGAVGVAGAAGTPQGRHNVNQAQRANNNTAARAGAAHNRR